jgi:predicted anti-sigma-YlaC factor YlaD
MSELATNYLDGAVPGRARVGIWLHLFQCKACRRYFDQVRQTVRLLGSGPPAALEPRTEQSLIAPTHRQGRHEM